MNHDDWTNRGRAAPGPRTLRTDATAGPGSSRGGGPRLDVAEWIVLLDIYQRSGGAVIGLRHPELIDASRILSTYAAVRGGARGESSLRSPDGLARRLAIF